ncbi:hypothetical protein FA15DRAFT_666479 [Coprinopsis marcescibilis]|uniref:Protein N-terminal glutamine amidohydrolase n=1 Tax=Coprinopsis marcescibilis TaxID=230819 RepID=A0A5C3L3T3_COPMA|nr:hypothetical protein FA15DRAFT_666479 [Coprinopsis marcescibilis]
MRPPALPPKAIYTSCYCEENIYLLCRDFTSIPEIAEKWDAKVVFVSNADQQVALFTQKSARKEELPVIWDYHVILILKPREVEEDEGLHGRNNEEADDPPRMTWLYDFDTRLPVPCPWEEYLKLTFPEDILPEYESCFRVVDAQEYLDSFASDRSHMIRESAKKQDVVMYSSPPPTYEPIFGRLVAAGVKTNLMDGFVNSCEGVGRFGTVYSRNVVCRGVAEN